MICDLFKIVLSRMTTRTNGKTNEVSYYVLRLATWMHKTMHALLNPRDYIKHSQITIIAGNNHCT